MGATLPPRRQAQEAPWCRYPCGGPLGRADPTAAASPPSRWRVTHSRNHLHLWHGHSTERLELLSRLVLIPSGLRFALAKKDFDENSWGLRDFL
jgi:hypothetical protein